MRSTDSTTKRDRSDYQVYRDAGLCVTPCGREAAPGRVLCPDCAAKRNAAQREARARRIAAGLCGRCGKPNPSSRKHCQPCREYNLAAVRRCHRQRLEAGLCMCCGHDPHRPGLRTCEGCGGAR